MKIILPVSKQQTHNSVVGANKKQPAKLKTGQALFEQIRTNAESSSSDDESSVQSGSHDSDECATTSTTSNSWKKQLSSKLEAKKEKIAKKLHKKQLRKDNREVEREKQNEAKQKKKEQRISELNDTYRAIANLQRQNNAEEVATIIEQGVNHRKNILQHANHRDGKPALQETQYHSKKATARASNGVVDGVKSAQQPLKRSTR